MSASPTNPQVWFTITPMLEDLDSLAARIGQLVQSTRQIQSERAGLLARIKLLEQERDGLRAQLIERETQYASMAQRTQEHDQNIAALRAEFGREQQVLKEHLNQAHGEARALHQLLDHSQAENARLRFAAEQSRIRIESRLERLPGPQE